MRRDLPDICAYTGLVPVGYAQRLRVFSLESCVGVAAGPADWPDDAAGSAMSAPVAATAATIEPRAIRARGRRNFQAGEDMITRSKVVVDANRGLGTATPGRRSSIG